MKAGGPGTLVPPPPPPSTYDVLDWTNGVWIAQINPVRPLDAASYGIVNSPAGPANRLRIDTELGSNGGVLTSYEVGSTPLVPPDISADYIAKNGLDVIRRVTDAAEIGKVAFKFSINKTVNGPALNGNYRVQMVQSGDGQRPAWGEERWEATAFMFDVPDWSGIDAEDLTSLYEFCAGAGSLVTGELPAFSVSIAGNSTLADSTVPPPQPGTHLRFRLRRTTVENGSTPEDAHTGFFFNIQPLKWYYIVVNYRAGYLDAGHNGTGAPFLECWIAEAGGAAQQIFRHDGRWSYSGSTLAHFTKTGINYQAQYAQWSLPLGSVRSLYSRGFHTVKTSSEPSLNVNRMLDSLRGNVFVGSAPAPRPPSGTWIKVADEWVTVAVPDNSLIRYGANGTYIQQTVSGSFVCAPAFFGYDPVPGTTKTCDRFVTDAPTPPPPPPPSVSETYFHPTNGAWDAMASPIMSNLDSTKYGPLAQAPNGRVRNPIRVQVEVAAPVNDGVLSNEDLGADVVGVAGYSANDIVKGGESILSSIVDPTNPLMKCYRTRLTRALGLATNGRQRAEHLQNGTAKAVLFGQRRLIAFSFMFDDVDSWATTGNGDQGIFFQFHRFAPTGNPVMTAKIIKNATDGLHVRFEIITFSNDPTPVQVVLAWYILKPLVSREWVDILIDCNCDPRPGGTPYFWLYTARAAETTMTKRIDWNNSWSILNSDSSQEAYYWKFGWYWPTYITVDTGHFYEGTGVVATRREVFHRVVAMLRPEDVPGFTPDKVMLALRQSTIDETVSPPSSPTVAPTNVAFTGVTGTTITWSCGAVPNATQYEVQVHFDIDANDGANWSASTVFSTNGGTITGLEAGVIYTIRVCGKNSVGTGPWGYLSVPRSYVGTRWPTVPVKESMGTLINVTSVINATNGLLVEGRRFTNTGRFKATGDIGFEIRNCCFEDCIAANGSDSALAVSGNAGTDKLAYIHDLHFRRCELPFGLRGVDTLNLTAGRRAKIERIRFTGLRFPVGKDYYLPVMSIAHMLITTQKPVDVSYIIIDGWTDGIVPTSWEGDIFNINRCNVADDSLSIRFLLGRGGAYVDDALRTNSSTWFNMADQERGAGSTTPTTGAITIEHVRLLWHSSAGIAKFTGQGKSLCRYNWIESPTTKSQYQTGNGMTIWSAYDQEVRNTIFQRNRVNERIWFWGNNGYTQTTPSINANVNMAVNTVTMTGQLKNQQGQRRTAQILWEEGTGELWGVLPY